MEGDGTRINMVTGQKSLTKLFHVQNIGGMGTQAPLLKKELEKRGHTVDIPGDVFPIIREKFHPPGCDHVQHR